VIPLSVVCDTSVEGCGANLTVSEKFDKWGSTLSSKTIFCLPKASEKSLISIAQRNQFNSGSNFKGILCLAVQMNRFKSNLNHSLYLHKYLC